MNKRIERLIEGLQILHKYSNEVGVENHQIVAGPTVLSKVSGDDQKLLEDLDWLFEENDGWLLWLG